METTFKRALTAYRSSVCCKYIFYLGNSNLKRSEKLLVFLLKAWQVYSFSIFCTITFLKNYRLWKLSWDGVLVSKNLYWLSYNLLNEEIILVCY